MTINTNNGTTKPAKAEDRVLRLLVEAEQVSDEAKRAALDEKAEKLLLKDVLADATRQAKSAKRENVTRSTREYVGSYAKQLADFVIDAADAFGHLRTLIVREDRQRQVHVVGTKSDLSRFNLLMDSLEIQALAALHEWQGVAPERKGQDHNARTAGSRAFIASFALEATERLRELRLDAEASVNQKTAEHLAAREERIERWVASHYDVG